MHRYVYNPFRQPLDRSVCSCRDLWNHFPWLMKCRRWALLEYLRSHPLRNLFGIFQMGKRDISWNRTGNNHVWRKLSPWKDSMSNLFKHHNAHQGERTSCQKKKKKHFKIQTEILFSFLHVIHRRTFLRFSRPQLRPKIQATRDLHMEK